MAMIWINSWRRFSNKKGDKMEKVLLIAILIAFFITDMTVFAIKKVLNEWEYDELLISRQPISKILKNQAFYVKDIYYRKTC